MPDVHDLLSAVDEAEQYTAANGIHPVSLGMALGAVSRTAKTTESENLVEDFFRSRMPWAPLAAASQRITKRAEYDRGSDSAQSEQAEY